MWLGYGCPEKAKPDCMIPENFYGHLKHQTENAEEKTSYHKSFNFLFVVSNFMKLF
jgi:hypothetical protein